jgi:L-aspartate oxidase
LEGLVYGARAGEAMREQLGESQPVPGRLGVQPAAGDSGTDVEQFIRGVQQLMWSKAGIVRTRQGMTEALHELKAHGEHLPLPFSRRNCEARNIHTAALLITRSALARLESRGAHYRTDYPAHDDVKFKKHSIVTEKGVRFE